MARGHRAAVRRKTSDKRSQPPLALRIVVRAYFSKTYVPGASQIGAWAAFPTGGADILSPDLAWSQLAQSVHQLPSCFCAPANQASAVAGGERVSFVQYPPLPLDGGLIMPAMCPLAASTKRVCALVSCAIRHAERQGTMWSFSAPTA
jgi:hypothetical protein